jgi:hypothetical protein
MGPLILYCAIAGAGFAALIFINIRDSYRQRQARRFAKAYNDAAHAQWVRFRQAHPEVPCSTPIARSSSLMRRPITPEMLARTDDDEAYATRRLREHANHYPVVA